MNIPNTITVIRILLVPAFFYYLYSGQADNALLVFITASISDGLDGTIAKLFNQRTDLGAILDPIADKLLINTAFVSLAFLSDLPVWLASLVFFRDLIIGTGITYLLRIGRKLDIHPIIASKITTFFQLVTVCLYINSTWLQQYQFARGYLVIFTVVFTVVSGIFYVQMGYALLGKEQTEENFIQVEQIVEKHHKR